MDKTSNLAEVTFLQLFRMMIFVLFSFHTLDMVFTLSWSGVRGPFSFSLQRRVGFLCQGERGKEGNYFFQLCCHTTRPGCFFCFFFFASLDRGGVGGGEGGQRLTSITPKLRVICPPKLQRIMYSSFSTSRHSLIDTMTQSVHLSRGNELWEETAPDRTIGIPIFESVRRKTPPGKVGGAKLLSHFLWTPLNWPRKGKTVQFSTGAAMYHVTIAQARLTWQNSK